jgi:hypothetical protein
MVIPVPYSVHVSIANLFANDGSLMLVSVTRVWRFYKRAARNPKCRQEAPDSKNWVKQCNRQEL